MLSKANFLFKKTGSQTRGPKLQSSMRDNITLFDSLLGKLKKKVYVNQTEFAGWMLT
jgi:hypothetical protein